MRKQSRFTTNHERIRRWAEERGGRPATVKRTRGKRGPGNVGLLRIDFPKFSKRRSLQEISWDEFFDQFDRSGLAFLFQDQTAGGRTSRFNKLVDRQTANEGSRRKRVSSRRRPVASRIKAALKGRRAHRGRRTA